MSSTSKTLRDEFAMAALTGLIAEAPPEGHSGFMWPISGGGSIAASTEERFAIAAYRIADAMMRERALSDIDGAA